jgi:head-tail adaptor
VSIQSLIDSHGVEVVVQRATRTVDAYGVVTEAWPTFLTLKSFVVVRGGYNVGGGADAKMGGKETRQQEVTCYFSGAPNIKFSDRIKIDDPIRSANGDYILEVRNVITPEFRPNGDALQYTTVRCSEVRQG